MKLFQPFCYILITILLFSCHLHPRRVIIVRMNGELDSIYNPHGIQCNKGDTIIVQIKCSLSFSKCESILWNNYKGKLPDNIQVFETNFPENSTFEKAIFLKEIQN